MFGRQPRKRLIYNQKYFFGIIKTSFERENRWYLENLLKINTINYMGENLLELKIGSLVWNLCKFETEYWIKVWNITTPFLQLDVNIKGRRRVKQSQGNSKIEISFYLSRIVSEPSREQWGPVWDSVPGCWIYPAFSWAPIIGPLSAWSHP